MNHAGYDRKCRTELTSREQNWHDIVAGRQPQQTAAACQQLSSTWVNGLRNGAAMTWIPSNTNRSHMKRPTGNVSLDLRTEFFRRHGFFFPE